MPRGRGSWAIRTGLFIRQWLEENGEGYIEEIHRDYKQAWAEENLTRPRERRVRPAVYTSFLRYFRRIQALGLVEFTREEDIETPTGEELLSIRDSNVEPSKRRYFKLTDKGREADDEWRDPNQYYREMAASAS